MDSAAVAAPRVTVVGSANLDIIVRVARPPRVGETLLGEAGGRTSGGKGLNQAVATARAGARTLFCGAVGRDADGDFLEGVLHAAGVETRLQRAEAPTGVAHILSLADGDNSIVVAAGANSAVSEAEAIAAVADADAVLAQLEIPLAVVGAALRAGRAAGAVTLLNAAPADPAALDLLDAVDVLIVNETETVELGGIDRLLAAGARTVVQTLGGDGGVLHRPEEEPLAVPAFAIEAVDTTGAGDAFCGALAAALAAGLDWPSALRRASAAGAITALHRGANTPELTPAAIDALAG